MISEGAGATQEKVCLVVLGMHRSGTSALAGALHVLGVEMGERFLSGTTHNEKGHFEHADVVALHQKLLSALGSSWDDIRPLPRNWMESDAAVEARAELMRVIRRDFAEARLWAVKDPRMCKLLPLWMGIFEELGIGPRFLLSWRRPSEVAESLAKRDGFGRGKSYILWLDHILEAEIFTRGHRRIFVCFEDFICDPRGSLKGVGEALGVAWPKGIEEAEGELAEFVQPGLRHHGAGDGLGKKECGLPAWVAEAERLLGLCRSSPEREVFSELAALEENYARAREIFGPEIAALTTGRDEARALQRERESALRTRLEDAESMVKSAEAWQRRPWFTRAFHRWRRSSAQKGKVLADPVRGIFDEEYYLQQGPAVAGLTPLKHYEKAGWRDGLDPHPLFDVTWYLEKNPEVARLGVEPLRHYLERGWREGRDPHPLFDVRWYLEQNPDVAEPGAEPLGHYLKHGWREGRRPYPQFDLWWFGKQSAAVRSGSLEPLQNYARRSLQVAVQRGMTKKQEARDRAVVRKSGLLDIDFLTSPGHAEIGRDPAWWYVHSWAGHKDLRRKPFPGFNPGIYAERNGVTGRDPFAHWIESGMPDGPWRATVMRPGAEAPAGGTEAPAGGTALRAALHIHLYYADMAEEIWTRLSKNRAALDLFITTPDEAGAEIARRRFNGFARGRVEVVLTPNRGRDIGAMLSGVGGMLSGYDVIGHCHTKKSPHVRDARFVALWKEFLFENHLGGRFAMADTILAAMEADPKMGIVFPEDPCVLTWGENLKEARAIMGRLGMEGEVSETFVNFPAGTFFWARTAAIRKVFSLGWGWDDYPPEPLAEDGTMLHALERLLPAIAQSAGYGAVVTHVPQTTR